MTRSTALLSGCFLALMIMEGPAAGQATVEAGLGAAGAATSTAPAKGLGNGIAGAFGSLDKALKSADPKGSNAEPAASAAPTKGASKSKPAASKTQSRAENAAVAAPVPAPAYEDPFGIQKGMGYDELERRFGPPKMQISSGQNARTLSYSGKSGGVQVEFENGKVISVDKL